MQDYEKLLIDEDFKKAALARKLCIFLGAGVGFNAKMPTWNELAKQILSFMFENELITHSEEIKLSKLAEPLKIISICEDKIKQKTAIKMKFNDFLANIFYSQPIKNYNNNTVYPNLCELYKERQVLIVQTNYDVIIEKLQFKSSGINSGIYTPYLDDEKTINFDELNKYIIYLHGRMEGSPLAPDRPYYEDLILTKQQYNEVYVLENNKKYKKQKNFIKNLLDNYHIIFLGYSLKDIEIMQMIANCRFRESYKKLNLIIDCCEANHIDREFETEYLQQASNNNLNIYCYSTEKQGYKEFENVVQAIKDAIFKYSKPNTNILQYINPQEVNFD